ncbi:unnamed protein product [Orchesella dallaii]|uniref:Uncharacterized protein n=1 Tax=Orchesella dallaii TaxID=48710 RepID=A0ABP1S8D0_9HEXA
MMGKLKGKCGKFCKETQKRRRKTFSSNALLLLFLLIIPGMPQETLGAQYHHHHPVFHNQKQWNGNFSPIKNQFSAQTQYRRPPPTPLRSGVVLLQPTPNSQDKFPPRYFVPLNNPLKKQGLLPFPPKCEGRKNLINDIGIISLITAIASSTFGMYTIIFNSITSNNIGIVSGLLSLILWLPSTLITFFNLNGSFIYNLSNFLNGASFFNAVFGLVGVWYGTWDVITSVLGESVGLSSLALSIIATFPDFLDELIELAYSLGNRRRLEFFVDNYGCRVPSLFTVMGRHFYDILDRLLVNSTKYVTNSVRKTL